MGRRVPRGSFSILIEPQALIQKVRAHDDFSTWLVGLLVQVGMGVALFDALELGLQGTPPEIRRSFQSRVDSSLEPLAALIIILKAPVHASGIV